MAKILNDWSVVLRGGSEFLNLPERMEQCLNGRIEGEERWVNTSPIRGRMGDAVVTRSGSVYELGRVSEKYESLFPGLRERLLGSLPMVKGDG